MNNGDSFHNGQENLELQKKNLLGNQEDSAEEMAKAPSADIPDGIPYYDDAGTVSRPTADAAEVARKSKLNIASLVLGIASFAGNVLCLTCLTPVAAILAIVFGCIGRVEGRFDQKGLIGMILGIVYCAITLLSLLFFITAMIAAAADGVGEPL